MNCDENVYTKPTPKSSIVTTLSCLEAVLFCRSRELTQEEVTFLDRGANYLLKQKLFRKVSTGEVIEKDWLEIRFPRFYEYDFLRWFYFLEKWRQQSGFTIPDDLVDEVEDLVAQQMTDKGIRLKRYNLFDKRSYNPDSDGSWVWGQASEIDLMKAVSFEGSICQPLTKKWTEVKPKTAIVSESYETVYKNPIKLKIGESVKIEKRETNPEWLGWVFHWFNGPSALREIHRVLKPGGKLGLIWNARDESLAWVAELTRIIDPHEGGAPRYKTKNWKRAFDDTKLFSELRLQHFSYTQVGTVETVVDRIGSISFISALSEPQRQEVLTQVRNLVQLHPETKDRSEVRLPYRTDVYWCEKI
jgi:hypothetical protein